ncbi:hypothetical protein DYBT9275_03126 [Dyadobacter sp. CECT 9275]|uniref:PA14 domain-containing protein n=1 Tax=Dyadobacter helix TaxID=2822344 RepID=A0A916N531_9BACT|nr:PA14 domain-containing protein [Dyadobacter sp. CECT 9275]CAG5003317.1 hypothetical protein DYBT9275_03126 [Dyadobacter sp. CECT 9275]
MKKVLLWTFPTEGYTSLLKGLFATIIVSFLSNGLTFAQYQKPNVNMPSPNAASLGMYGEVPVSLYTGTPNIDIPVYTIDEGKIKVPISLSYHASGVRVNQHPGWVGLNWNLNAGGAITRTVKGANDEHWVLANGNVGKYGYNHHTGALAATNWNEKPGLVNILQAKIDFGIFYDTEPDEFSFNFLGYSGKFYKSHLGDWQVVSDSEMKIQDQGLLAVPEEITAGHRGPFALQNTFGGFVITTADGMKFSFGGTNSAIEYSTSFFDERDHIWVADTWFLTKIETPEGLAVNFTYAAQNEGKFIASFNNSYQTGSMTYDIAGYASGGTSSVQSNWSKLKKHSGNLIRPVYLNKITFPKGTVDFSCSNSTELKYPERVLKGYVDWLESPEGMQATSEEDNLYNLFTYFDFDNPTEIAGKTLTQQIPYIINELIWKKLDNIVVKQKDGKTIQNIELGYNNSADHRLMLKKVSVKDGDCKNNFNLSYHNEDNLPEYFDEYDQTDHWGFYNNNTAFKYIDIEANKDNYFNHKQPSTNINVLNAGSLKEIIYPTGGKTEFIYEPHTIYKYKTVNTDGSFSLTPALTQGVGGLRIKKIISTGNSVNEKSYSYEWNGGSSGIGNGLHQYQWLSVLRAADKDGGHALTYARNFFMISNTLPMSANSLGSHIGYREVKETNSDQSYTVYKYTNYESEDGSHMDDYTLESNKWGTEGNIYDPQIDKSIERGKLLSEEKHAVQNGSKLVSKREITYKKLSDQFIKSAKASMYDFKISVNGTGGDPTYQTVISYLAAPYGYHAYQYKPEKEELYQYDETDPTKFTLATTEYTYNGIGLPTEIKTKGNGETTRTLNKYAYDYSNQVSAVGEPAASLYAMKALGMQGTPVEQQIWNDENGTDAMVDGYINLYRRYGANPGFNNIQVEKTYRFSNLSPVSGINLSKTDNGTFTYDNKYTDLVVDFGTDGYTTNGEPKQFTASDGITQSYTWGTTDETGLLKSKTIGNQTTTFEYTYPLIGVSKITDPNQLETRYSYDNFNRLSEIRDYKNNLVQSFTYNLKNNEGCPTLPLIDPYDPQVPSGCSAESVAFYNNTPENYTYTINVPTAGTYTIKITYNRSQASSIATGSIKINGGASQSLSFAYTAGSENYQEVTVNASLVAGKNTFQIFGGPNGIFRTKKVCVETSEISQPSPPTISKTSGTTVCSATSQQVTLTATNCSGAVTWYKDGTQVGTGTTHTTSVAGSYTATCTVGSLVSVASSAVVVSATSGCDPVTCSGYTFSEGQVLGTTSTNVVIRIVSGCPVAYWAGTENRVNRDWIGLLTGKTIPDNILSSCVKWDGDVLNCVSCTPPSTPVLSASPSTISVGGSSTLTASNCSGTITWSDGLGTGTTKTVSPSSTKTYTATCTVDGCVSANASVTVSVSSSPLIPVLSIWKAGVSGVRTKIKDLAEGDQIQQSSFGGGQANWFIAIAGQVTNSSGANYYDKVQINLDGPGGFSSGWGPDNVAGSDGGPFGLNGRDGGYPPTLGSYQIRGKVFNGSTELGSKTINFSIVNSCTAPSISKTSGTTVCSATNQQVTLTATGCSGTVTWYKDGTQVGTGATYTTSIAGSYTATCTDGSCVSGNSSAVVVSATSGCDPVTCSGYTFTEGQVLGTTSTNAVIRIVSGCPVAYWAGTENRVNRDWIGLMTGKSIPDNVLSSCVKWDGDALNCVSCTTPSAPSISKTSGTTVCSATNQQVTLTATGCSGTVTWYKDGTQVGTGATYTTNLPGSYTATCTVGSCVSTASSAIAVTQTSGCEAVCSNPRNAENPSGTSSGLNYKYYESAVGGNWCATSSLSGQTVVKAGNVTNFSLGNRNRDENFGFEFTGYLDVPADGEYTFYLGSDDAAVFYIGSQTVVSYEGCHGTSPEQTGTICLKAGKHAIKMLLAQGGGGFGLELQWAGPGLSKQSIADNRLFRSGSCTPPSTPVLSASPSTINVGGSSTLTASNCSGTITWSDGLGTGTTKTVSPSSTKTYSATCTVDGCVSANASVTVTVSSSPLIPVLSIWKAGVSGVRTKIKDLAEGDQIQLSSFGGGQANWFIAIAGQVTNSSGANYYDKVQINLDGPGGFSSGWGPDNVAGSDGGPFGLNGRDGGYAPTLGSYQIRGKVFNGSTELGSKTINFSIVSSCSAPTISKTSGTTVCSATNQQVALTATGCSGTVTWYKDGTPVGTGATYTTSIAGSYTATCTDGSCVSGNSSAVVVSATSGCDPVTCSGYTFSEGQVLGTTSTNAVIRIVSGCPVAYWAGTENRVNRDWIGLLTGKSIPDNILSSCVKWDGDALNCVSCTTPSAPSISKTSGTTVCSVTNQQVTLTATGCSGTVTWYKDGTQVGTGATYTTSIAGSYTATCTVGSCVSTASSAITVTQTSGCEAVCSNPRNAENPSGTSSGLNYKYYESAVGGNWCATSSLSGQTVVKAGNVTNFSLGNRNRDENFGFEFTGYLDVPADGEYTFYLGSDDAAVFYIGSQTVVSYEGCHGTSPEQTGTICLKAGKHAIKMLLAQGGGGFGLELQWAGPGLSKQSIADNRLFRSGSCTPPSTPVLSASPSTINVGGSSTLTASNCSGTITWSDGLGTGTTKTVSPSSTKTYSATCTVDGCVSANASVTVTVSSSPLIPVLSIWKAGVSGVRTKIKDLAEGDQIQLSSFGGGQANWFIAIAGQVTNSSGANYYDKVQINLDGPGGFSSGWGPDNVAGSDGGPFGLNGRDGGYAPTLGSYQIRGKVFNGSTELGSKTINFSIVSSCSAPTISKTSGTTVCSATNQQVALTATGCSGTVTWYKDGTPVGTGATYTTSIAGSYTATCTDGSCVSGNSSAVVVSATSGCDPVTCSGYTFSEGQVLGTTSTNAVIRIVSGCPVAYWAGTENRVNRDWIGLLTGKSIPDNILSSCVKWDGDALNCVSCTTPSAPSISKTSGTTVCSVTNQQVTLTATGCSGTVTWYKDGTQVGTGATYTTSIAGSYTATCTVGSCVSTASSAITVTQTSGCEAVCSNPRNAENPSGTSSGLNYKYYESAVGGNWCATSSLSGQTVVKAGNVTNFSLGNRNRDENFGFEFTGYLDVPADGEYTFYLGSDDAAVFYIGSQTVVSYEGCHGTSPEQTGTICLKAGKHAIKLLLAQGGGGFGLELQWAGPGLSKQSIADNRLFRSGSCTPPSTPVLSASPSTISVGGSSTLTASNCSGTITWSDGLGTGTTKTVSPSSTKTYSATCTVDGCVSANASVTVTVSSAPLIPVLSIWKAGVSGVRTKIKDLAEGDQIQLSSFGGGQANWFIAVAGQVTNSSGANYYDKVQINLDGPGGFSSGWGPDNVAGSDGGPFGLNGRDGGYPPTLGSYQIRGKVFNGSTELGSKTINFSIICNTDETYSQVQDARVMSHPSAAGTNYGSLPELNVGAWTYTGVAATLRTFINFSELAQIPQGATIVSATLMLKGVSQQGASLDRGENHNTNEFWIQRVTSSWSESGVTWINQPSTTTANQVGVPSITQKWDFSANLDVKNLIQDMVNLSPNQRFGLSIKLKNEVEYQFLIFSSKEASDASKRPRLQVKYTCPSVPAP